MGPTGRSDMGTIKQGDLPFTHDDLCWENDRFIDLVWDLPSGISNNGFIMVKNRMKMVI